MTVYVIKCIIKTILTMMNEITGLAMFTWSVHCHVVQELDNKTMCVSTDKVRSELPVFKTNSVQVGPSGDSGSEKTDKTDRGIGSIASDDARHRPTSTRSPDTSWNSQRGMCV